jgi:hypothetical protein
MLIKAIAVGIAGGAITSLVAWSPFIPDFVAYHAVWLAIIAAVYLGFAFADGRPSIAVLEMAVATGFLVLAFLGLWLAAPAFIAAGLFLHAFWDLVHQPRGITTRLRRWYPPFCAAFDFVFAGLFLGLARVLGTHAH